MIRVLVVGLALLAPLLVAMRAAPCRDCTQVLDLTPGQWNCLGSQLPSAAASRVRIDPRIFDVDGCGRTVGDRGPTIPPPPPLPPPLTIKLSVAQQRCVSNLLVRATPTAPVNLRALCR